MRPWHCKTNKLWHISIRLSSEYFGSYEEFRGVLTQINDSIYYVKCFKNLTKEGGMPFNSNIKDTLSFICDSTLINKNISIEYKNKSKEQFKIYSTFNKFKINKNYFNINQDKIKLTFGYLHPIVDETVEIIGNYGSDIVFNSNNYFNDFYIVLDSTKIKTINLASDNSSFGPRFDLKRMYIKDRLNMGRKLYGQKND